MSVWDDPEIKASGDYVKFENVGDKVVGTILAITKHTFQDGKVCPKLTIREDDGNERVLTAAQVLLKQELVNLAPEVGQRIAIVYIRSEALPGGKTLKHWDVKVGPAASADGAAPVTATAAAAPSASDLL